MLWKWRWGLTHLFKSGWSDRNGLISQPAVRRENSVTLMFVWKRKKLCCAWLGYKKKVHFARLSAAGTLSAQTARLGIEPPKKLLRMYTTVQKKSHWTSRVNESAVCKDARGEHNVPLRGGAEDGEFAYIGQVNEDAVVYKSGKLTEGELLLEVENLAISGLPLYDVQTVMKNCKGPIRLKTVRQGKRQRRPAACARENPSDAPNSARISIVYCWIHFF